MFRASDFKCKEVINLHDGERMGYVYDLEIDEESGGILSIMVPGRDRGRWFGKNEGVLIPWHCISRIGEDIILVNTEH